MKTTLTTIAAAARASLQWRLLLLWTGLLLVPTLLVSAPVWHLLAANLDYSADAARLAQGLDLVALSDLRDLAARQRKLMAYAALLGVGVTLLMAPLLSGMALAAARADARLDLRALVEGGLRDYPRMLRMALWSAVPLGAALALGAMLGGAAHRMAERALLEAEAQGWTALAALGALLAWMLAHAGLDAGRAVLALDRRRRSALAGWWAGMVLLRRQPLRVFGAYAAITLAGMALAGLLAMLVLRVSGAGSVRLVAGFVLTQAAVAVLAWMRSARLFALVRLAR